MKKRLQIFTMVVLFHQICIGQTDLSLGGQALPQIVPPTPEAYSIAKFGSNPIGMNSGSVVYSLPLYSIPVSGGYNIPLSLSYTSNGVKVDEVAGRVGMQWKMDFTGVINRTVVGDPDEYGALRPSTHDSLSTTFYNFLKAATSMAYKEAHPDQFNYSIPGYSGKFVLDRNGNTVQIPYNNLKITNYGLDSFKITTPDGVLYSFGAGGIKEQTLNSTAPETSVCAPNLGEVPATTAWYLNSIKLPNGQEIKYVYEYASESGSVQYLTGVNQTYSWPGYLSNGLMFHYAEYPIKTCYQLNEYNALLLKEIQLPTGKVKLKYSARDDIPGEKKLDTLIVLNVDSVVIKKYAFDYQYSYNSSTTYDSYLPTGGSSVQSTYPELRKRLFLSKANDVTGNDSLVYKFDYESIDSLPPRLSFAQDYWGYFNGVANQLFFAAYTLGGNSLEAGNEYGADKRGNFSSSQKGILKKITYPTGGHTEYTYEPADSFISWKPIYDTLILDSILTPSSSSYVSSSFQLEDGISKIRIIPTADPFDPPGEEEEQELMPDTLLYVQIKNSSNEIVWNYTGSVWQEIYFPHLDIINAGNYTLHVQSTYPPQVYFDITIYKLLPDSSDHPTPAGGVRVKSIVDNDGLGNYAGARTFTYQRNWRESTITPNAEGLFYAITRNGFGYDTYEGTYNLMNLYSSSNYSLYTTDLGAPAYEKVNEIFLDKNQIATGGVEHKYYVKPKVAARSLGTFPYTTEIIDSSNFYFNTVVPGGTSTNTDLHNGTELEIHVYKYNNGSKQTFSTTRNFYSIDTGWFYTDTLYNIRRALDRGPGGGIPGYKHFADYDITKYFVISDWMHLDSTVTVSFTDAGDSLITNQAIEYGNVSHMQPKKQRIQNSKGQTIETVIKYPADFSGTTPYSDMLTKHMIATAIEQTVTNKTTNTEITKQKTNYSWFNSSTLIKPSSVQLSHGGNSLQTELTFDRYDTVGNLLQYTPKSGVITTMLWGYNKTYPVAKVDGASYNQVSPFVTQSTLDNPSSESALRTHLNYIRSNVPGMFSIGATYTPLLGVTSQVDINGRVIYYEYDAFGRLKLIRDRDNNILKMIDYKYQTNPQN
jgi:YD repeat-containing protein